MLTFESHFEGKIKVIFECYCKMLLQNVNKMQTITCPIHFCSLVIQHAFDSGRRDRHSRDRSSSITKEKSSEIVGEKLLQLSDLRAGILQKDDLVIKEKDSIKLDKNREAIRCFKVR